MNLLDMYICIYMLNVKFQCYEYVLTFFSRYMNQYLYELICIYTLIYINDSYLSVLSNITGLILMIPLAIITPLVICFLMGNTNKIKNTKKIKKSWYMLKKNEKNITKDIVISESNGVDTHSNDDHYDDNDSGDILSHSDENIDNNHKINGFNENCVKSNSINNGYADNEIKGFERYI